MQVTTLELLAPAGNRDIGIAAIDCGADALYIAGSKVYLTLNTIIFDNELGKGLTAETVK